MPAKTKSIRFVIISIQIALLGLIGFVVLRHSPHVKAAGTIVVNTTADNTANDGVCTLREAIISANTDTVSGAAGGECAAGSGADTINFAITGAADFTNNSQDGYTIELASALPHIVNQVTVNGYSQPGAEANTAAAPNPLNGTLLIEVDGNNVLNDSGFIFAEDANNSAIRGLVINNFTTGDGILALADSIEIQGNYIGTNPTGASAESNQVGVNAYTQNPESGHDVLVGGLDAEDRNLISGNTAGTTSATGSYPGEGWVFKGNYLGVAANGLTPITNSTVGGSGTLSIDGVSDVVVGGG